MASFVAGAAAFILSTILLQEAPTYKSTVSITMQPSDEELIFNQGFLGVSQFNPATIIAQSHVERLLSRPVRDRTIAIILGENADAGFVQELSTFKRVQAWFWRTWNTMNYGYHVPLTPEQELDVQLKEAVSLEIVEGSYIMLIEVEYGSPELAAQIANSYAQAYVEIAQEDFRADAREIQTLVNGLITRRRGELDELLAQRSALQQELGVGNAAIQWELLLTEQQDAAGDVEDARIAAEIAQSRVKELQSALDRASSAEIAQRMNVELVTSQIDLSSSQQRLSLLRAAGANADAAVSDFVDRQSRIGEIDVEINALTANLESLQSRRVALDLSNEARLSQVRVIDPAVPPLYPAFPKVFLNTAGAAIVGAILALIPILFTDAVGNRIKTFFDLRTEAPNRALPDISGKLLRQARRYLRNPDRRPGARLSQFAERLGQFMGRDGWWSKEAIHVSALSSETSNAEARDVLRAAIALLKQKSDSITDLDVVCVADAPAITDWEQREHVPFVFVTEPHAMEMGEVSDLLTSRDAKQQAAGGSDRRAYSYVTLMRA